MTASYYTSDNQVFMYDKGTGERGVLIAECASLERAAQVMALLNQADETQTKFTDCRAAAVELYDALDDMWNQFAYDSHKGKWSGGLSSLELCEDMLERYKFLRPVQATP